MVAEYFINGCFIIEEAVFLLMDIYTIMIYFYSPLCLKYPWTDFLMHVCKICFRTVNEMWYFWVTGHLKCYQRLPKQLSQWPD